MAGDNDGDDNSKANDGDDAGHVGDDDDIHVSRMKDAARFRHARVAKAREWPAWCDLTRTARHQQARYGARMTSTCAREVPAWAHETETLRTE
eukprot:8191918-Pyramimonas_sp.AAC.1